jgi:methionyl-tRNA synthetase
MLNAAKQNLTPEAMIANVYQRHIADLTAFDINYDHYYTTHSPENQEFVYSIYQKLKQNGYIATKTISQLYDETKQMFLPDRFVKGICPKCSALDQYGDNCEVCGATYQPTDLIKPFSVLSGSTPVIRESEHYFFSLSKCQEFLKTWVNTPDRMGSEAKNKMHEWLNSGDGLQDWDISRDAPYFGFLIPNTTDKYFYVWLDAPIGYMSTLKHYCDGRGIDFEQLWNDNANTEIHHFLGKDILYFHALFWPALLHVANYNTPTRLHAHGYLTVNGQKMSKSRGTFITARALIDSKIPVSLFRYYIASKLNNKIEDVDFSITDFTTKVNSELVGKFVNIAARSSSFLSKFFNNHIGNLSLQHNTEIHSASIALLERITSQKITIANYYNEREFSKALKSIMALVDEINIYVDNYKPWLLAKDSARDAEKIAQDGELHQICGILLNAFRYISIYLKPVIPSIVKDIETYLNISPLVWHDLTTILENHTINPYTHLLTRIDDKMTEQLIIKTPEANTADTNTNEIKTIHASETTNTTNTSDTVDAIIHESIYEPIADTISIDDFAKVDLRVAKIVNATHIVGADKLVQLTLDIGSETRNVFAGIKSAYKPEDLIGEYTIMVANLAPRKMKFGVSEGMVLAASFEDKNSGIYILEPHAGAKPGMRVR